MATDIFNRTATTVAGVFTADQGRLSFGGGVPTALVQNFNATYSQLINRLYEVGNLGQNTFVYYVGGRTNGNLTIGRVVGPAVLIGAYYTRFGDVCKAKGNSLDFALAQVDCSINAGVAGAIGAIGIGNLAGGLPAAAAVEAGPNQARFLAKYCVITQIGISVGAQDMIINENSALMFSSLEYHGA